MNFYKRFMADYAKKTTRLTLEQHGAYTLLLDEIYATECPLPADYQDLYRVCRAMTKNEQAAVRFVADAYFPLGVDGLRNNPRAAKELSDAAPKIEAARLNGVTGGRPPMEPIGVEKLNPLGFEIQTDSVPNTITPQSLEEYQGDKSPLSEVKKIPNCPHSDLIDLYAKNLPELSLPRKSLWINGKNADAMRSRWRWVMTEKYEAGSRKGTRMATCETEALAWFDRFFGYVSKSDWLTGRADQWRCDLGWLMNASNFEKVLQGNYENKREAA